MKLNYGEISLLHKAIFSRLNELEKVIERNKFTNEEDLNKEYFTPERIEQTKMMSKYWSEEKEELLILKARLENEINK